MLINKIFILLEDLKVIFFSFDIINSSLVFGFLPNLWGEFLLIKEPNLDIFTILVFEL